MKKNLWYISKYTTPKSESGFGGRGYMICKKLVDLGYNVSIFASDSNHHANPPSFKGLYKPFQVDNLTFYWIKTFKFKKKQSISRIVSWIHFEINLFLSAFFIKQKPHIVIASSLSILSIICGLFFKFVYNSKLIFEVRDIWPLTLTEEGGYSTNNIFVRLLSFLERIGYEKSDHIIGTMPNLVEHVKRVTSKNIPVTCIPMGYDETDFIKSQSFSKHKVFSTIHPDKFIICYIGSMGVSNALDDFIKTIIEFSSDNRFHFIVAGDGDLRNSYKRKCVNLGNVSFLEPVPRVEVYSILSNCNLLYLSTHNSEVWKYGQSLNKVVDYMLSGRPILASYSGYESMINDSGCGKYISQGDIELLKSSIIEYFNMDSNNLSKIGKKGQDWIKNNRSYNQLASDYDAIFKNFL